MILKCNSCEKKFVVPDQAITSSGRTVQCGSCGNKWRQFPIKSIVNKKITKKKINPNKSINLSPSTKIKKKRAKKTREIDLYSPEYLQKKHGISLNNINYNYDKKINKKISFGFYNSLILFSVTMIVLSRALFFFQDLIIENFPFTSFYINYFFENIRNIFEILKNLISNY